MAGLFANRGNQIVSRRILTQSDFRQLTQSRGQGVKVTKGSFKVLAPSNLWSWLQVSSSAGPLAPDFITASNFSTSPLL
jgi:hypothetical protein